MLFLNAAALETEYEITQDNIESSFQVNYLAQFYLARLLLPNLLNTKNSRLIVI
jgi:NAD(P)-dependent dehydrogenase (short-subunit alcohol dehydrogenase family)